MVNKSDNRGETGPNMTVLTNLMTYSKNMVTYFLGSIEYRFTTMDLNYNKREVIVVILKNWTQKR